MLGLLLPPQECVLTILEPPESPGKLADHVAEVDPDLLLVSHLPPGGSTAARYLVRRLRARFADLPILVGFWSAQGNTAEAAEAAERLTNVGATHVVFGLAEARDQVLLRIRSAEGANQAASPIASVTSGVSGSLIAERIR